MGSVISSFGSTMGSKKRELPPPDPYDEKDEDSRPAKRKKLNRSTDSLATPQADSTRKPFGHVTNGSARSLSRAQSSSRIGVVEPSDFYGRSNDSDEPPMPTPLSSSVKIQELCPRVPINLTEAMRVDIIGIKPSPTNDGEPLHMVGRTFNIKCRVSAALFYAKNDEKPGEVSPSDFIEISRLSNIGILKCTWSSEGIQRDFTQLKPFLFEPDMFYVTRKTRKPNGQWNKPLHTYGFADRYSVHILVEYIKYDKSWPPVELHTEADGHSGPVDRALEKEAIRKEDLQLSGRARPFAEPTRHSNIALSVISKGAKAVKQVVPYVLNAKVQFSVPNHIKGQLKPLKSEPALKSNLSGIPPIVAPPADEPNDEPSSSKKVTAEEAEISNSPADGRAHRNRSTVMTYDLKALSRRAQGKNPYSPRKKRKPEESRLKSETTEPEGESVTYVFGKAEAIDIGINTQTTIAGYTCPFCNGCNNDIKELQWHLLHEHSALRFNLRRQTPPRLMFSVEVSRQRNIPTDLERSRTFQLNKPTSLLDLDRYLAGDNSWVKNRHGPQHNKWPDHLLSRANDSSMSSSPFNSRLSSPNTPRDTEDGFDGESYETKEPERPRKIIRVPKTAKPLYHTITKRVLIPGEVLPNSDDELDETWLHQKHRDQVNDFTDVTPEEKEYIHRWNPFILGAHLTSPKFLPDAMIRFLEKNIDWLEEGKEKTRRKEWGKHMEVMILQGTLTQDFFHICMLMFIKRAKEREAEQAAAVLRANAELEEQLPPRSKHRGLHTCVCGKHPEGPDVVVCRESECPARWFCRSCAQESGRDIEARWKCDECFS